MSGLPLAPPRRVLVLGVLAALLLPALWAGSPSATGASTITGETVTAWRTVYIGTDATFTAPDYSYGYLGVDEGIESCQNRQDNPINIPVCRHQIAQGTSQGWIDLRQQPIVDPDARAGVGVAYALTPGCTGQTIPAANKKMTVSAAYERSMIVTNTGGLSYAEIWANATGGRGDLTAGESPTGPQNDHVERWNVSSSTASKTWTKSLDTPAPGNYKALVYSHGKAQRASLLQAAIVEAKVDLKLNSMTFDWTDTSAPTVSFSYRNDAGGALTPIYGADGGHWFRGNFTPVLTPRDDFSCTKDVRVRYDVAHAPAVFDVNRNNDPIVLPYHGPEDVALGLRHAASDRQGNLGWERVQRMGIDTVVPQPDLYVSRWSSPAGRDGWYRSNVDVAVDCWDNTSGCYKAKWWVNGAGITDAYSFPRDHSLTADGRYNFTCTAYDNTYLTASCQTLFVGIDRAAPNVVRAWCKSLTTGVESECLADTAFTSAQRVRLECGDALSGCKELEYRLDNGNWTTYAAPFDVTTDGSHPLELRFRDVAGNEATRSVAVDIDSTAPGTPVVVAEKRYRTDTRPAWSISVSDASGRVKEIRLSVNGAARTPIAPGDPTVRYDYHSSSQGDFCLVAQAIDYAGNLGPASDPVCVMLDWYTPIVNMVTPGWSGATWEGTRIGAPTGSDVIVGWADLSTEAGDSGSGIERHVLGVAFRDGAALTESVDCGPSGGCAYTLKRQRDAPVDPEWYRGIHGARANVADRAGHTAADTGKFYYFTLLSAGAKTGGHAPYAKLWFAKYVGAPDFAGYEIHRSLTPAFQPTSETKIADVADVNATYFEDWGVTAELTYDYRIVYKVRTSPTTIGTYEVSNHYPAQPPGRLSGWYERVTPPSVVVTTQ